MKTYAYSLITFGSGQIRIGRQGENLATRIDVDVTPWKTEYPTGTISLFVAPPVGNGYLAALEENGNTIRWTIRDTDTAYDGHGKAELILKDASGAVMKSVTAYTICAKSPSAAEPADPPEAIRPWVEQILEAIKSGDVSAEAIAAAVEAYIKEHGVQVEEADPTVPSWAKQPNKPTYTASEVGALPSSYTPPVTSVNGKTGEVALNAQDVGARPDTWTPSASDVGADAAGTASGAVAAHNTSGAAHADLRALIEGLTSRLNVLADSDDTTLDQLSEIVAYIKSNKALIDAVTTGKVSVSDIVDNLTTNASGKVLSAAQGVALKAMIDGIVIPTALPNPQPITINGQRYDGSEAVTVTVSSEGGGTPVEIDDTLTQSGKAADAKAVGDQLSALNEAKVDKAGLSLGVHTDGLVYVFVDGKPAGNGIALGQGGVVTYAVINNLEEAVNSNTATSVTKGSEYTALIVANEGFILAGVTVTMGGVDVTDLVYSDGAIVIPEVTGDITITAFANAEAVPADIMSNFKYLGPTTYSPGVYTSWCPSGLIYDEDRDVYAHFMNVQNHHYAAPNACELWFNTIDPYSLEHEEPVFIARTAETLSGNTVSSGALGCCVKNGVYYMFSVNERGYYKSEDGGATWTHEQYENGPKKNPWGCYVLSDGRMIMGTDTNTHDVYFSDDNGKNWTMIQCEHFNEPTFVDFGNGVLMAICRENKDSSNNLQPPWMHVSYDNGESWTQSVAMETVGYMGNNNCNAYVHDNYVELFVGCRNWSNSPQWDENLYKINQYVLNKNKGPVDEFEFVNTVYYAKNKDNPQGNLDITTPDDFSTPVIAIKDKSHALLMFYGPSRCGVTHHLVAVGNVPVNGYAIPSIIPNSYNASQSFENVSGNEITICETYNVTKDGNYPKIQGGYLKLDDINDGGFVHVACISNGFGDSSGTVWTVLPTANVVDGKIKSASVHTGMTKSPLPNGVTSVHIVGARKMPKTYASGDILDLYAFIKNEEWWVYDEGTWYRNNSGDCDVSNITYSNYNDHFYAAPNHEEGLTTYKVVGGLVAYKKIKAIEYDKRVV